MQVFLIIITLIRRLKMATEKEITSSLTKQGLNPSNLDLVFMVACVVKKVKDGDSLDKAVYECYKEVRD